MSSEIKCKLMNPPYIFVSPGDIAVVRKTRFTEMHDVIRPLFKSPQDYLDDIHDKYPIICQELSDYIVEPTCESKSAEISVELRENGNAYFKSDDLEKALERYTMSIAFAPAGSLELALAYANRSAVLFKAKWMSDCLVDIDHALQLEYPDNLKAKLFLRKASCHHALDPKKRGPIGEAFAEVRRWLEKVNKKKQASIKQMLEKQEALKPTEKTICYKFDFDLPPPKLKAENPDLPGLSDAVKLQYSQEFGRHCVATRDIKPGEVIGVQKPYVHCVELDMRYKICWHCGKQTWSSIPCDGCAEVIYCSTKCRDNAHQEYHDVECYVLRRVLTFGLKNNFIIALRLTIKALKESNNSLATVSNKMKEFDAVKDPMKRGLINGKLDPNNYSSVLCLDKPKYQDYDEAISNLIQSLLIAYFLTKKMKLVSSWQDDLNLLKNDELFLFLIEFIANNDRLNVRNRNAVQVDSNDPAEKTKKISISITPCFALFNHSCVPTTNFILQDKQLVMSSNVPIKKNEQIFINNRITFFTLDKSKRGSFLSEMGIECQCKACVYDWPRFDQICNGNQVELASLTSGPKFVEFYVQNTSWIFAQKSIYKYAKENNRIIDYSKERASCAKLVEELCPDAEMNSIKTLMAISALNGYIHLGQRPFLHLN